MLRTVCSCTPLTASKKPLMTLDDLMSVHVCGIGNEPLKISVRVCTIGIPYYLLDLFLYSLACVIAFSRFRPSGTRSYRDTPPMTNLSLNRHTSNDIWLHFQTLLTTCSSTSLLTANFSDMADSIPNTKLHAFNRKDTTYTSDDLSIGVSVFVPKSAEKGQKLPVLVRWHGGALINGGRVYEPWFPKWYVFSRICGSLQNKQLS